MESNRDHAKHRAVGHARLEDWAVHRAASLEGLGAVGVSTTERMRQFAQEGPGSTVPGALTIPESQAQARGRTLQVERAVESLPETQRRAVVAKYVGQRSLALLAEEWGTTRPALSKLTSRAVAEVGRLVLHWGARHAPPAALAAA